MDGRRRDLKLHKRRPREGIATRRPKPVLAVWGVLLLVLGALGTGVEGRLKDTGLALSGTESHRAKQLQREGFGNSIPAAILLEGPPRAIDEQGPRLVATLYRHPRVRVLSPWDPQMRRDLRPRPGRALVLADFDRTESEAIDEVVPAVERAVEESTGPPVRTKTTGLPFIAAGIKDQSVESTRNAEKLTYPVLLLVLLLVFRTPVAAAIPMALGAIAVVGAKGLIAIAGSTITIDSVVVPIASMMGLALGVDYALLVVSRFREELAGDKPVPDAVANATNTAGRTIVFAGAVLTVSMLTALAIAPGGLLVSVAAGVLFATIIGVAAGVSALPALLMLVGRHVDRWPLPGRRRRGSAAGIARRTYARPAVVAGLVLAALLLLAAPTLALDTGPLDVRQLPRDNQVRKDFEAVQAAMGPGWAAPFQVVMVSRDRAVTEPGRLRSLSEWQRRLARDPRVKTVVGPGSLEPQARQLDRLPGQLDRARKQLRSAEPQLMRLRDGLSEASNGVEQLAAGLREASAASSQLATGAGDAEHAALLLGDGAAAARQGGARLGAGLDLAATGTTELVRGLDTAARGARRARSGLRAVLAGVSEDLRPGLRQLLEGLRRGRELDRLREPADEAATSLDDALRELEGMTVGKGDPRYTAVYERVGRAYAAVTGRHPLTRTRIRDDYDGMSAEIAGAVQQLEEAISGTERLVGGTEELERGLVRLERGAGAFVTGIGRLRGGAAELDEGLRKLAGGADRLETGLARLDEGAQRFAAGITRLADGGGRLADGLSEGSERTLPLKAGLAVGASRLSPTQIRRLGQFGAQIGDLRTRSPGLFDSGYFMLAALDGARATDRRRAQSGVGVDSGGQAARVLIVPKSGPNDPKTAALGKDLTGAAIDLGGATRTDTALGGQAGLLRDYDRITSERLPLLMIALAVTAYLLLVPILRALLLPLIAVLLNLATVAAAFGLLTILFQEADLGLGGPGYLDAVSAAAIFTIVFGLSIDYEVFLLTRMREGWLKTGDASQAIEYGLDRTARVVTGAALIMTAVFLTFATIELANIRQLGLGLAVAVILDATVVRLVLLPALMRIAGEHAWWLPEWLDRRLPSLDVESSGRGSKSVVDASTLSLREGAS